MTQFHMGIGASRFVAGGFYSIANDHSLTRIYNNMCLQNYAQRLISQ